MAQSLRTEVLATYRRILRVAKTWEAKSGNAADTLKEKDYIKTEAKLHFRNNKLVQDTEEIRKLLKEAEARIVIAYHYRNPYPRPVNVPPKTFVRRTSTEPTETKKP